MATMASNRALPAIAVDPTNKPYFDAAREGKLLIGLYLAHAMPMSAFGAAASLAIVMLWVYGAAQVLLLSAELTQVIARRGGRRIVPDRDAVALPDRHSAPS